MRLSMGASWRLTLPWRATLSGREFRGSGRAGRSRTTNFYRNLDLAPDGKRFVVIPLPDPSAGEAKRPVHVTFLLNFFDELKRRLP